MVFLFSLLLEANEGERRSLRQLNTVVYMIHPWCLVLVRRAAKIVGLTGLLVENTVILFLLVLASSLFLSQLLLWLRPSRPFQTGRAWIELDLSALRHNVNQLQSILPENCTLMPAVKANAYGHGAVLIAKELNHSGIRSFCVATVSEGMELRRGGVKGEILVLGYTHPEQVPFLRKYRLTQTVIDIPYRVEVREDMLNYRIELDTEDGLLSLSTQQKELSEFRTSGTLSVGMSGFGSGILGAGALKIENWHRTNLDATLEELKALPFREVKAE